MGTTIAPDFLTVSGYKLLQNSEISQRNTNIAR